MPKNYNNKTISCESNAHISNSDLRYKSILETLSFVAHASNMGDLYGGLIKQLQTVINVEYCSMVLEQNEHSSCRFIPLLDCAPNDKTGEIVLSLDNNLFNANNDLQNDCLVYKKNEINRQLIQSQTELNCLLIVRLNTSNSNIGYLHIGSTSIEHYEQSDMECISKIAEHLALAINHLQQITELNNVTLAFQAEMKERERAEQTMKCIVEGTGAEIGNTFFKSVAQHMANAIGARYAFVGELIKNGSSIKTIAVWRGNQLIDNFSYSVEGATGDACADKVCYCCHSVTKLLPNAEMQKMMRVKSCWGLPLNNSSGETVGVLVVMHDAHMEQEENIIPIMKIFAARSGPELERINMEADLFNAKERAQVTVESIGDGVITTDSNGLIDYLNPIAEQLTGWGNMEARGLPLKKVYYVVDEATRKPLLGHFEQCIQEDSCTSPSNQMVLIRRDGQEFPIANTVSQIHNRNHDVIGSVVIFSDVSELRHLVNKMAYQASHDALTGLVNRREFETRLQTLLKTAEFEDKQHALCYIDLDRFKLVNDTCGHLAGDELLKQVSAKILSQIRDNDTLARVGGDEFSILLQGCQINIAERIAGKVRQAIEDLTFIWEKHSFDIGVSIGVVAITKDSGAISNLLSKADSACYIAKEKGRNNVHVHHENDIELAQRHGEKRWLQEIKTGLEFNKFVLYFQKIQPLSNTDDHSKYFEVLIRLVDSRNNLVSPMTFIPAAERYNLMPDIDCWVIRKTFSTLSNFPKKELKKLGHCSINLSGQSLGDNDVLHFIINEAEKYSITPSTICFEITETAAISNLLQAKNFMSQLSQRGFVFALDDFGSGLSSFTYLKNLPVKYLKIDGEFVKDMTNDKIDYTMVDAINRIGHVMGIKTVAEYVENTQILENLRHIGVDFAQGYGIAKPKPFSEDPSKSVNPKFKRVISNS